MTGRIGFACLVASCALSFPFATQAGKIVETQQSMSYELPEGWTVSRWTQMGEASLKNEKSGDSLHVERHGLASTPTNYPNSEKIDGERTLTWEYKDFWKSGDFTLSGEVKLKDAIVRMSAGNASAPFTGANKEAALKAMRSIARSVKIVGPRKCWWMRECPPGEVK